MKKLIVTSTFILGFTFGAIASEMSSSGLYIFKAGDPIIAEEVNSNFSYLEQQINKLKIEQIVAGRRYDCELTPNAGFQSFELSATGLVIHNEIYTQNGVSDKWTYNPDTDTVDLNSNPVTQLKFSYTDEDNYFIKIEPIDDSLSVHYCYRT